MEKKKGFTLIELMIVIVILAVLASLVLPKMMAQPERALIAEAVNYLGVIRRAQESLVSTNEADWVTIDSSTGGSTWGDKLGLGALPAITAFDYRCTGGNYNTSNETAPDKAGVCTAKRKDGPKKDAEMAINLATGKVTYCGSGYIATGPYNTTGTTCV